MRNIGELLAFGLAAWCTIGAAFNLDPSQWWVLPLGWLMIYGFLRAALGLGPVPRFRHHWWH